MSRRMKKNRRVLSFALAFVMLVSLLPLSAVFSALAVGDPDISVEMQAGSDTYALEETAEVTINAELRNTEQLESATVTIHFEKEEAEAIQQPEGGWGNAAEWIADSDDGGADLKINLTQESNHYQTAFTVAAPKNESGEPIPFTFDVNTGSDIECD